MTEREKFEANEKKERIYYARGGVCEFCRKPVTLAECQMAHRIPKSKMFLKMFGKKVIHSAGNLALTCSLKCNAAVNIGNNPGAIEELVGEIEGEE